MSTPFNEAGAAAVYDDRQRLARALRAARQAGSVTWLTPPPILDALGGADSFDLDPCAAPMPRPWPTARAMNAEADGDGLALDWWGRPWLNPPYTHPGIAAWLAKIAAHGRGCALIFARTETEPFQRHVWEAASGLLFLEGRLHFHYPDGRRAPMNAGAPSVLAAYGAEDRDILAACGLAGAFVPLRLARGFLVQALDSTWREIVTAWLQRQDGPISVSDAYRFFCRHPKIRTNPNWRAKVRQTLQRHGRRVGRDCYQGVLL